MHFRIKYSIYMQGAFLYLASVCGDWVEELNTWYAVPKQNECSAKIWYTESAQPNNESLGLLRKGVKSRKMLILYCLQTMVLLLCIIN